VAILVERVETDARGTEAPPSIRSRGTSSRELVTVDVAKAYARARGHLPLLRLDVG
jgi:hypothetical protein